eukprot:scpid30770/ scgid7572/ 
MGLNTAISHYFCPIDSTSVAGDRWWRDTSEGMVHTCVVAFLLTTARCHCAALCMRDFATVTMQAVASMPPCELLCTLTRVSAANKWCTAQLTLCIRSQAACTAFEGGESCQSVQLWHSSAPF